MMLWTMLRMTRWMLVLDLVMCTSGDAVEKNLEDLVLMHAPG